LRGVAAQRCAGVFAAEVRRSLGWGARLGNTLLQKYNKENLVPISTPAEARVKLEKSKETAILEDIKLYQQYIGSLIYLTTHTRPDIAFAVYSCARHMSNPSNSHFTAVNRIFKYLNHTKENGLYFKVSTTPILLGYTDADWGG
jgi:hypothetical protein